ncbi:hypothetical protein FACS189441_4070 [Betaproteobacteria bacterium]|nr:hypothetical protein FACS189441_4070 [Betaproteobacteria bacterium]
MKNVTMEQLARFENAQETLGMMVAIRTNWITQERRRDNPDNEKIACWQSERQEYEVMEDALRLDNEAEINRVLTTYNPQVRSAFEQPAEKEHYHAEAA